MVLHELSWIPGGSPAVRRKSRPPRRIAVKRPLGSSRPRQTMSSLPHRGQRCGSGFGAGVRVSGAESRRQLECSKACRAKGTSVARRLFPQIP